MSPNARRDVDVAIARYREDFSREADVGRATLDEIEDHLRDLVEELQASGMPAVQAVTEAARRLGDPRELAREHARVRTPFGAKLPLWRALTVIALVLPQLIYGLTRPSWIGVGEGVIGLVLCGALVWRSAWARAVLFGILAWNNVWHIASLAMFGQHPAAWMLAMQLGALVMLVPWRRADLTAPGWALAMLYPMYTAGSWMLGWQVTTRGEVLLPDARFALLGIVLAGAGLVLRARWAAIASAGATIVLGFWLYFIAGVEIKVPGAELVRPMMMVVLGSGIVAGIATTFIAWRTARSNTGELRNVLA